MLMYELPVILAKTLSLRKRIVTSLLKFCIQAYSFFRAQFIIGYNVAIQMYMWQACSGVITLDDVRLANYNPSDLGVFPLNVTQ